MRTGQLLLVAALSVSAASVDAQDVNGKPNYGTVDLSVGFAPDPHVVSLQSGGEVNAESISSSCRGFITNAPDLRLNYSAGTVLPLIISVSSSADTTLVVNAPDGSWYCDDDGGMNGLNPMVRFNSPASGRYEIWVGTYGGSTLQPASLHISELESQ